MRTPWLFTGRECSSRKTMKARTTADTTPIQTRLTTTMCSAPPHSRMQRITKVQAIKAMVSPSCKWCRIGSKSEVVRVYAYKANLLSTRIIWRKKRATCKVITYVCDFYKLTTWSRTHASTIVYPSRLPKILRASKASRATSVAASFKATSLPRTRYKYRPFLTEQLIRQVWSREPRTTIMLSQNSRIV